MSASVIIATISSKCWKCGHPIAIGESMNVKRGKKKIQLLGLDRRTMQVRPTIESSTLYSHVIKANCKIAKTEPIIEMDYSKLEKRMLEYTGGQLY